MTEETFPYLDKMDKLLESIETRQDLAEYLEYMAEGFRDGEFEDQSVADYLEGAASITEALHSWCKNNDMELPEQPDWKWMGIILTCAFYHS